MLMLSMDKPMLVKSLRGNLIATHFCQKVNLDIKGVNFKVNPIVLESLEIDVVLGGGWFSCHRGKINQDQRSVSLTTPSGVRIEYEGTQPSHKE